MVPMFMDFPGMGDPKCLFMTAKLPEVVTQIKEEDEGRIRGPCWVRLRGLIEEEPLTQYSWSIFKAASHMLCIGYGQVGAPRTTPFDQCIR